MFVNCNIAVCLLRDLICENRTVDVGEARL
jgi:hypothetical protein